MFEKEAEELFKKKPLGYEMKPELEIYTDGFKDGYNKAKVEDSYRESLCNSELNLANVTEQKEELEAQVEKMKCCQNCKFEDNDCIEEPCSVCTRCLGGIKRKGNSDKWEIKEI